MKVLTQNSGDNSPSVSRLAILVFLLGSVIRLFSCQYTYIINPDGVLYIHQARALYYGQWESLTSCGLDYLSNYPFFIAGAYILFHNWVVSAKAISFLFGSFTLIPLYFLLKRFFDETISSLVTLIYALTPVFVGRSADVVRGPVYWFFLTLGFYFFVVSIDKEKQLYLTLSCMSFLMATWARVEATLIIIVSCFYLLAVEKEHRIRRLVSFVLPVLLAAMFFLSSVTIFGVSRGVFARVEEIPGKFTGPLVSYQTLRSDMADLVIQHRDSMLQRFLYEARRNIWLIAFGTLLNRALEAFFYPFFLVIAIGLGGIGGRIKRDRRIVYFLLLACSGLILLYAHIFHMWWLDYRFMAISILPCSILAGFGLEKILSFIQRRFHLRESLALATVCLLILFSALPKNLQARKREGLVFRQIATTLVRRESIATKVDVAASAVTAAYISFYANLAYPGSPCPKPNSDFDSIVGKNYKEFVWNLRQRGIKYFIWEEKNWPSKHFDFMEVESAKDFLELGRWYHPDTGHLILFEVR